MEETSEILLKYQKLALEYSKLKAQISVLKSAVSDEQSAVAELQETLKKKDQFIRKLEQEVECLNFRNLQLTKRVSVLQSDLDGVDANSKHSKVKHVGNHSAIASDSYDVLNVELQSRIEENEKLHKQIYAAELQYKKEVSELTSTVERLQTELTDQERKLNDKIQDQDALINVLQKEKIKMQVCLKNHEEQIKNQKVKDEAKTRDITFAKEDLMLQLENAKNIIADKVLFNDMHIGFLNALNVPTVQRRKHEQICKFMGKMQAYVSDFMRQLGDLYTFMIQRLCSNTVDSDLKPTTVKLELHLRDSIQYIKAIPVTFDSITSAVKDETLTCDKSSVLNFSTSFQKYVISLDKLLPFLILRVQNKNTWIHSSSKVVELMPKLTSLCKKLIQCFKKLLSYIQLFCEIGSVTKNTYYASQTTIMFKIHSNLGTLQALFEECRALFGSKIASDHQLPMITQSEKSTDECILSTLVCLSSTLKKVTLLLKKDKDLLSYDVWFKPRNCRSRNALNPAVWQFRGKAAKYLEKISTNEQQSIPYEIALENYKKLSEHADNEATLTEQLEQCRNKLMQLELDKENWMLECQLMKAKEAKNSSPTDDESNSQGYEEIQQFVKSTVNQLVKQIQFADSKCIAFKSECETLHQRLKMSIQQKEALENEIRNAKHVIDCTKEEQKTLMQTYEEQLNTMSEHLANLNETLTAQKDEIDALRQAGSNKGTKKGKSK